MPYERFTDRARNVMQLANQDAHLFDHEYIGPEMGVFATRSFPLCHLFVEQPSVDDNDAAVQSS
jgi:hypothetical protein